MSTMTATISTRHGEAQVWLDDESDPSNPGYVVRYSNGDQDHLDEYLTGETDEQAEAEAREFLAREGLVQA